MSLIARKLASGSIARLINSIATALVSLLIMPYVVHTLGDRMYGVWTLVATLVGYYGILELGLSQAITRYLARSLGSGDSDECNRVFNTALRIYSVLGAAVLLVTAVCASLAPRFCRSPEDASLFWKIILVLGLSLALQFPIKVFKGVLEAHLRFDLAAGLDLLTLGLRTVLILAALHSGYKVLALAWVTFLAGLPSMALSVYLSHKELPFLHLDSRYWRRATAKVLFSYSAYSFISQIAGILRFQVDNVVVAAFLGLEAVTHYSIASRLAQSFTEVVSALLGIFPSVFSRLEGAQDSEGIRRTFFLASRLSLCIAAFIAFGMLAWGKPFITSWMGPRYLDSYPVLVALVLSSLLAASQSPSVALLFGTSKHKFFALMNSIEGGLNLILSLTLVHTYGLVGVAVGTLIPMALSKLVVQPVYLGRASVIGYVEYMKMMGRTSAIAATSLVLPLVIATGFARPEYKVLCVIGAISAILYVLPLWFFVFSPRETRLL